jgi:hypothetical protein
MRMSSEYLASFGLAEDTPAPSGGVMYNSSPDASGGGRLGSEKRLNSIEVAAITGHKTPQMLKRYTLRTEDFGGILG